MTSLDGQLASARQLLSAGREEEGLSLLEKAFPDVRDQAQRIDLAGFLGVAHGRSQRWADAERWFGEGLTASPDNPALLFELGEVYEAQGKTDEALGAILSALNKGSSNARHFLAAGARLMAVGRDNEALQVWSLGDGMDPMLTRAHSNPQADEITKARSRSADQALRRHFHALHERSVSGQSDPGACTRVSRAVWCQTHPEAVVYAHPQQKPQIFYLPDLEPVPAFPREELPWAEGLERAFHVIAGEYKAAIASGASGAPYIHEKAMRGAPWDALRGQKTWEALHLFKDGKENRSLTDHFPNTLAALDQVPLVRPGDVPLEVFFSVLKPGAHIPPHFGLANSRLTVHLPIIVPPDCAIQVADHVHAWTEGQVFAFDDSFAHEAWNKSRETRVVLIFEAWSPLLTGAEQRAITASFEARMAWLESRLIPSPDEV